MTRTSVSHSGTTLLELLVTLSILGVIAAVTTLALRRFDPPRPNDLREILDDSLREALATGRSIRIHVVTSGSAANVFVGNAVVGIDGSIVADSIFAVERFTGASANVR